MYKVITYGTFDLIHHGHINILKKAKELGEYLIVGLSSDEFNEIKGKKSYHSFEERKLILESIKYVDEVIAETNWGQKETDIKSNDIQLFVMGSDWENKFDELKLFCNVIYLPRTEGISTSKIKKDLSAKI